jgi:hypothetical protein
VQRQQVWPRCRTQLLLLLLLKLELIDSAVLCFVAAAAAD